MAGIGPLVDGDPPDGPTPRRIPIVHEDTPLTVGLPDRDAQPLRMLEAALRRLRLAEQERAHALANVGAAIDRCEDVGVYVKVAAGYPHHEDFPPSDPATLREKGLSTGATAPSKVAGSRGGDASTLA